MKSLFLNSIACLILAKMLFFYVVLRKKGHYYFIILLLGFIAVISIWKVLYKADKIIPVWNQSPSLTFLPFPVSKDFVVYHAHYDNRPRRNYRNVTRIFVGTSKRVYEMKLILGCGVRNTIARNFKVGQIHKDELLRDLEKRSWYSFEDLAVECYDVPVLKGDRAFVIFKSNIHLNKTVAVQSEKPVVIPASRVTPKGNHTFSVVVCTAVHQNGISWLPQFLRYQKTLGIDHVHLAVLDKYVMEEWLGDNIGNDIFFVDALKERFVTLQIWNDWYAEKRNFRATVLMYLDCIYRYQGTYDFVALMETDEFFTVRIPGMTYKDIILKYCSGKSAYSCTFSWIVYNTTICDLRNDVGENGNVTASLMSHISLREDEHVYFIYSISALTDSSFLYSTYNETLKAHNSVSVSQNVAYVAKNTCHRK